MKPPSAAGSPWTKRLGGCSDARACGGRQLRGARRRRAHDRGAVPSDQAHRPDLRHSIAATDARGVIVTHGQVPVMARRLRKRGLQAEAFETEFGDERVEEAAGEAKAGRAARAQHEGAPD